MPGRDQSSWGVLVIPPVQLEDQGVPTQESVIDETMGMVRIAPEPTPSKVWYQIVKWLTRVLDAAAVREGWY